MMLFYKLRRLLIHLDMQASKGTRFSQCIDITGEFEICRTWIADK
jgi:hypothetical protein